MVSNGPRELEAGSVDNDLGNVLREYMEVTGRLQRTHEALQGEVLRLRKELASKDRELELRRRLAALGELAAGVAHEVRNPLGAIQLYSGLLRTQCRAHQLAPALELVEKIEAGIQAIDAVVQDTLALAPRDRQLGACDVGHLLEQARDSTVSVLEAHEVRLDADALGEGVLVRADENGLQRVLVNLIVNAVEVSQPGQVVWVKVDQGREQEVEIRVVDSGPGLADEIRDRIFDPFFTTKKQGTGLGLTIAHRLIEAYGGRLTADNGADGGAEFAITLPRATASGSGGGSEADARETSAA